MEENAEKANFIQPYEEGPYVQVACLCKMIIRADDNSLSVIKIIDTVTHTQAGPTPPKDMPIFTYDMVLLLSLKAGKARGRSTLKITPELPNGSTKPPIERSIHFEGEEKGINFNVNMNFVFEQEGLYWFNVFVDEIKISAIPMRVKYERVIVGPPTPKV